MKRVVLSLLTLFIVIAARADLIWLEGFDYSDGNITNSSSGVWANFSGGGTTPMLVNNSNLEVSTTGGTVSRADDDLRLLTDPYTNSVQVLYASFTVICTNLPNGAGSYFASFYNPKSGTGGGFFGRVQAFTNGTVLPNTWRLGVTANTLAANPANGGYPVDLALNTPYQVVEELDPTPSGLQAATIWINPVDMSNTGLTPTETHYTSSDSIGAATTVPVAAYAFREASSFGNGFWIITNLAVATTFGEAATNVWGTNAFAPTIVYQPVGVTNFVGASISLSAVANGQGLGNMTYQWLQNGNPYPNGNGMNVLSIPSAQASDSGDYKLVATTPFGLSVTSSVAKVSISAAPVPPIFVTQPASQTAFKGQDVTFSTSVNSPGNVSFTWYSNNVVVTDGVNSSGGSSSLTLVNVQTNFSAAYKVAVTNDVVANGVVSTNAVLTVLNPPAVSVAYLRTLVDPTTYQPTNVPPTIPYQVTGVITTYTNTTTGLTASYFLQDATAGINIFATFGSDFRPQQGDVVTFVGVLSSFSTTGLELFADTNARPYTSYSIVSNNFPLPTPRVIPFDVTNSLGLAYVNTNLAGSLVKIQNVYFGTNAGTQISTTANQAVFVTNAIGQSFKLQFFSLDQDTAGQTLPAFASSVTGVLYGFNPDFSIAVTKFSDIDTNAAVVPIPLNLSFSGGILTFTWSDPSFNLQSATNVIGPYTTVIGAVSGFTTNTAASQSYFRLIHP